MQALLQLELVMLDPAWIRTGLRVIHLCGLVLGVGSATLLDLIIARFILMRGISHEHVYIVDFSSKVVAIGLGLLWISGIGFLFHYGIFEPAKLQNPKIWAKIAIVAVLTINGFLVHHFVLPRLRNQVGKRLLDGLSPFDCSLVFLAGTVSVISWYVPLILGAIPQLNYVVPAEVILSSYALLLVAVNTVMQVAIALFLRRYSTPVLSGQRVLSHRSKTNLLRGSLALALGSICFSLFMTKATDHGTVPVEPATTNSVAGNLKVVSAVKEGALAFALSQASIDASGSRAAKEQPHAGSRVDAPRTAEVQSEGQAVERAVLVRSGNIPEPAPLYRAGRIESFARLSKATAQAHPPQLKSGFVGAWASEARACESHSGTGIDLRTIISERGARAGGNSCAFKQKKQIANAEWEMKALCEDGSARWESTVRLSLSKNKLKWSGQRGTQVYVKCT
jgi:hypothetical protein